LVKPACSFAALRKQALKADIERHSAEMKGVDQTGTYLKYFGSKQDTVYVRNRLSSVRLRWKRLLRRADETGRTLDKALGDAKRVSSEFFS
jgi:dystonin